MILEYLLLISPLVVHLVVDSKGVVRHWLNACYVLALSVAVGFILPGYFWQGALYALAIHFAFFDPVYNLMHRKNFFYNGTPDNPDRAMMDKFWDYFPNYVQVFIRLWVLGVGIGVYYKLDLIFEYL